MSRALAELNRTLIACELCPRLRAHCESVALEKRRAYREETYWGRPVPSFGDPRARLLIVGLAPAAHGANRTGRMFTGDSSGEWLYEALHRFGFASAPQSVGLDDGLELTDCWITAAAHCAPPDNKPTPVELEVCGRWLERELALLARVQVVITLGHIAHERWLKASARWARMEPRERPVFAHARETALGGGITLIASYHPSRQNTNTGRLTHEMWHAVFGRAREILG